MPLPPAGWRDHHGVVPPPLGSLGVSRGALATLLKCGELIGVREGVYRHVLWPDTFLSQCAGLCAADPAIVVTCGGAAQIWRYRRCSRVGLHVSGTGTGLRFDDGPVHHRCPIMPAEQHSILATMASASPGSAVFAAVLSSRPTWRRPADSHPEIALRRALSAVGVHLEPQLSLTLADGKTVHPDLGDPDALFYIEIDDHEWHGGRLDATYDLQRDRLARLVGARIERVSTDEIAAMPPSLLTSLAAAYRQQRSLSLSTRSAC